MNQEFEMIASEIFKLVGPIENILSMKNSRNTIKLNLKNKEKIHIGHLKSIEGVGGIVETQNQLHIIITHDCSNMIINEFYKIASAEGNLAETHDINKQNGFKRVKSFLQRVVGII